MFKTYAVEATDKNSLDFTILIEAMNEAQARNCVQTEMTVLSSREATTEDLKIAKENETCPLRVH